MNINVELALKVNKLIHEECIDGTPHDIGWNVMKLLNDSQPKMVEVEKVVEWVNKHVFYDNIDELVYADQLLNFLNEQ